MAKAFAELLGGKLSFRSLQHSKHQVLHHQEEWLWRNIYIAQPPNPHSLTPDCSHDTAFLLPFFKTITTSFRIGTKRKMDWGFHSGFPWAGHTRIPTEHLPAKSNPCHLLFGLKTRFVPNHLSSRSGQQAEKQNKVQGLFVI